MANEFDEVLTEAGERINAMSAMNESDEIYKKSTLTMIAADIEHMNLLRIQAKIDLINGNMHRRLASGGVLVTSIDTGTGFRVGLTDEELITLGATLANPDGEDRHE